MCSLYGFRKPGRSIWKRNEIDCLAGITLSIWPSSPCILRLCLCLCLAGHRNRNPERKTLNCPRPRQPQAPPGVYNTCPPTATFRLLLSPSLLFAFSPTPLSLPLLDFDPSFASVYSIRHHVCWLRSCHRVGPPPSLYYRLSAVVD